MKEYAKEFHAKHLGNCAMAVAAAWLDAHQGNPSEVEKFRTCGGGRAEGGLCGALYAAIQYRPDKKDELIQEFRKRSFRKLRPRSFRQLRRIRPKLGSKYHDRILQR